MQDNFKMAQGIVSILALLCLVIGWFNLLSPELSDFFSRRLFYLLIGLSFILQAPFLGKKNYTYIMFAAAAFCIVGSVLPIHSKFAVLKTIGLLAGVALSFVNRSNQRN